MPRIRFDLIGEGRPLVSVVRHLASSPNAEIGTVATASEEDPIIEIAKQRPRRIPDFVSACKATGDWLININSGTILPGALLQLYKGQALNLHNGPLPAYAGRHVTQWGIRNGETEFAATVHFMEPGVDTGDIVSERRFPIRETDTGLSLFVTSFKEGQKLMKDVLERVLSGEALPRRAQDLSRRRNYRHAEALDPRVPWASGARCVMNFLRAGDYRPLTSPTYTAAASLPDGTEICLFRAVPVYERGGAPGSIVEIAPGGPIVGCGAEAVLITDAAIGTAKLDSVAWARLIARLPQPVLSGRA